MFLHPVHDADDDSTGRDHMVRSSGRRGLAAIVERLSCLCGFVVLVRDTKTGQKYLLAMRGLDSAR